MDTLFISGGPLGIWSNNWETYRKTSHYNITSLFLLLTLTIVYFDKDTRKNILLGNVKNTIQTTINPTPSPILLQTSTSQQSND